MTFYQTGGDKVLNVVNDLVFLSLKCMLKTGKYFGSLSYLYCHQDYSAWGPLKLNGHGSISNHLPLRNGPLGHK